MSIISKAELLIKKGKFAQAEEILKTYLIENPNDGIIHSLLSKTYIASNKLTEAIHEAKKGVSLNPESAYPYFILSKCLVANFDFKEAKKISLEALKYKPEDEYYLCNHASILNILKEYNEALKTINKALERNPEHTHSKRIKSAILRNKGLYNEADILADDALKDSSESALSFINKGWILLDKKSNTEALECFKTAVMIDPNNQFAKSSLIMGIKTQNKIFDIYYRFQRWVETRNPKAGGFIFFGVILLTILVYILNKIDSDYTYIFNTLWGLCLSFFFITWTINPIFNVLLRFNKYGKYALNKAETIGSNIIAALIILSTILWGVHYCFKWFPIRGAIGATLLIIPVTFTISQWKKPKFKKNVISTILLTLFWIVNIILPIAGLSFKLPWIAFLISIFALTTHAQK